MLLAAFAAGIWGTVLRPPAYELRGVLVVRAAPDLILVRHESAPALGMGAMDLMAVSATPEELDRAEVRPGDSVRLAVRQDGERLRLLRIEKLR